MQRKNLKVDKLVPQEEVYINAGKYL
uniref:Uncharacterized protein n=1 Tax=Arundo donax TaxID=35708 RepID=A0A0A8Y0W5_ARUDO